MKITVEFDNEAEFEAFKTSGKRTRTKKEETDDAGNAGGAPEPLKPPAGGQTAAFNPGNAGGFAPQGAGATAAAGGPFAAAAPVGPSPEVLALVGRINVKMNAALASGQPADQALTWLRGQIGAEAASATMEQAQNLFLPKLSVPQLEAIAKLMNA